MKVLIVGEEFLQRLVSDPNVLWVAGQCSPPERAQALAEQWTNVGGHETGEFKRPVVSGEAGFVTDGVAVVEHLRALVLELHHGLHLRRHRLAGLLGERRGVFGCLPLPILKRHLAGQVGQRVMRAGLVGDNIHRELPGAMPQQHLREHLGGVAHNADGQRLLLLFRFRGQRNRLVQVCGHHVQVAFSLAALQPGFVHIGDDAHPAVQGHGQRLRTAHAAAPAREGQSTREGAAEALPRDRGECFKRALQNPLGGDVNPRPGGHLAIHDQTLGLQLAELRPGRPVPHQVGISDQHARCPRVRAPHPHRLTRLH